jgi:hypothetical protein
MDIASAIRARHRTQIIYSIETCKPTLDVTQVPKTFHGSNQGNGYLCPVHFANPASEVLAQSGFPIELNKQFRPNTENSPKVSKKGGRGMSASFNSQLSTVGPCASKISTFSSPGEIIHVAGRVNSSSDAAGVTALGPPSSTYVSGA